MGALTNTCKSPLGPVLDILEAQYAAETEAWRRSQEERIKFEMHCTRKCLLMFGEPQNIMEIHMADGLRQIADMRARPGGRCVQKVGRGRCRGVSRRFSAISKCPRHHGTRYSKRWCVEHGKRRVSGAQ